MGKWKCSFTVALTLVLEEMGGKCHDWLLYCRERSGAHRTEAG